jgi:hypothetical protein
MVKVKFTSSQVGADRKHYLTESDVMTVLERLPREAWNRLRVVHFNDESWGVRRLASANVREHRICICALPPRVSLTRGLRRGHYPELFGAVRGKQWPELAVRRFLLYNVLLHEVGHLQLIDAKRRSGRRDIAGEKLAQQFADHWRQELWAVPFDHPDPVHNPPVIDGRA